MGNFFLLPSCTFPTNLQNEGQFTTSSRYTINSSSKNKSHKPSKSKHFEEVEYFRMDEMSLCGRRQSRITQGGRWFALGHCCAIVPWLVPRALTNFSHVWGCFVPATAGVHRCCCEPYPDFHRMLAAAVAVWSLSLISWPRGHHPSACPPAHSRHPGLPQWTQDYNIAAPCSSDVLCPSLHCHYSQVHPVTMITTVWIYRDCNNASFKGCVSSVMYSGCFGARRDNWTLAAVLGMPCGFRHRISQLSYVWL